MKTNQLKAGVLLSYLSMFVKNGISILYTPVMLRLLGQSEYGLYQFAFKVVGYLGILNFGFGSAYMRFYFRYKAAEDEEGIARLNGTFLLVFFCIAALAFAGGSVLVTNVSSWFHQSFTPDEVNKAKILMAIMVVNLAAGFPLSLFSSYVSAHEKFTFQRVMELLRVVINPMIMLPLLLLGYKSIAMAVVMTALTLLNGCCSIYYCFKKLHMRISFGKLNFSLFREIGVFSSFIFLNMIADQINWNLDTFIIGKFVGTAAVAVYGLGSLLNGYYMDFSMMVSTVFIPKINKMVASGQSDGELTDLFTRVGRIQFMIMALLLSSVVIFGRAFLSLYGGPEYEGSYAIAVVLIAASTAPMIQCIGIEIQRAKNLHKFRSVVNLAIAVANGIVSVPLCIKYGGFGCAVGTAVTLLIGQGLIMNLYYQKRVGIDILYFWRQIARFIPGLLPPLLFGIAIMVFVDPYDVGLFLLFGALYVAVYAVSMWSWGLNQYEKNLFAQPFARFLTRIKRGD